MNFSEDAAYKRIHVARLCRRLPVVWDYFDKIHLSGLAVLAAHLNENNCRGVLERACFKTKREIETICAELAPKPDLPARVRAVPVTLSNQLAPGQVAKPARVAALAPVRFAVQVTISKETKDKLDRARELLPGADLEHLIDRALTLLVNDLEKKKFAKTNRPRETHASNDHRRVPNNIKRAVFERDQGQCTFHDQHGHRCTNRLVEFDHVKPFALGGQTSFDNLRLRCKAHNLLAAEEVFGQTFIQMMQHRT